jgi:hypothetical protein
MSLKNMKKVSEQEAKQFEVTCSHCGKKVTLPHLIFHIGTEHAV